MPKVSVILPIYNVAPYLDEAFQSLINQTLEDIEIIAVNDGSTDESQQYIEKYAKQDVRIKYFYQNNQGQSVARNLAIEHATGEYIYMMDSDDRIELNTLEACYQYAEHTKADFIFFDGDIFYDKGAEELTWDYKRTYLCKEGVQYQGDFLLNKMIDTGKHSCVVWLLFIRKKYIDKIDLSFYSGIIHEDELYTTILTLSSNNIFCLQKTLVHHRVRNTSTMGKRYSKRNIDCYLTVFDELFNFQDSPLTRKFAKYTLSKVFYTGHIIPLKDKPAILERALKSGYLKYIGWKNIIVFLFKS